MIWMLLAFGGAAGALARYAAAGWVYRRTGTGYPWGTLAMNVIGSFLLGAVLTGLAASPVQVQLGALLAVGFLGDFTTFSTWAYESVMLAQDRQWASVLSYVVGTIVLTCLAVLLGMIAGTVLASS